MTWIKLRSIFKICRWVHLGSFDLTLVYKVILYEYYCRKNVQYDGFLFPVNSISFWFTFDTSVLTTKSIECVQWGYRLLPSTRKCSLLDRFHYWENEPWKCSIHVVGNISTSMSCLIPNKWASVALNGTNLGPFEISVSTFWLGE